MRGIYKRFTPTVVVTHNPETGDYGHPNHMAAGWACVDAFDANTDSAGTTPLKLYITSREADAWRVDWNRPEPHFAGRTSARVAAEALRCHRSQDASSLGVRDFLAFTLHRSRVGDDVARQDLFENCSL